MWRQAYPSASRLTSHTAQWLQRGDPSGHPTGRQCRQALKGVLVLLMLVYHAMSIASNALPEDFRLLRFVTGSFIFLSGWSIGAKWAGAPWPTPSSPDQDHSASQRDVVRRGLQLLLLFAALNLGIWWSGWGHPDKQVLVRQLWPHPLDRAWAALVLGHPAAASFSILWPLGWLMVSMGWLHPLGRRRHPWIWPLGLALTSLTLTFLASVANASGVLDMLLVGWIAAGSAALSRRLTDGSAVRGPSARSTLWAAACIGGGLWFMTQAPESLPVYVVAIACILKGLHDLIFLWFDRHPVVGLSDALQTALTTLGRMSLWAYVAQIVMIQGFRWGMGGARWPLNLTFWMVLALSSVLLWVSCETLEFLRHRHPVVDRAYRWVFP